MTTERVRSFRTIDTTRRSVLYGFVDETTEPPRYAVVEVNERQPNLYATAAGPFTREVCDARMLGGWNEGVQQQDDPFAAKRDDWHDAEIVAAAEDAAGEVPPYEITISNIQADLRYPGGAEALARQLAGVVLPPMV